jgi:hypothetical protein
LQNPITCELFILNIQVGPEKTESSAIMNHKNRSMASLGSRQFPRQNFVFV